ncbi:putative DNA mismatch repair protein [Ordospora colligata OC4]|uniref:Putative DNA mismatch repair protein n=1 Tax=Ordospora colligata OC4 TaxID=1354746 RepID=A0A0B2UNB9_9MICR|nr:putative DNA mismatch repair protein [Ordospora colligata OC4]KHN70572.1 putative DNA mismatch repair protein [Ordospora colligata OC4]
MTIRKLPDDVIARISAGEVITRPLAILKETIENSLDAHSTHITVRLEQDGLSLAIEDNGEGINENDFGMLCKQYCTSKITSEDELFSLCSYGFRGEALSSISRCSKVKVRSKKKQSDVGYEAAYNDTEMVSIRAVGMNDGTCIEIKNIFYNNKLRGKHFLKHKDEVKEMMWLLRGYSIFNIGVLFTLIVAGKSQEFMNISYRSKGNWIVDNGLYHESTNLRWSRSIINSKLAILQSMCKIKERLAHRTGDKYLVIFSEESEVHRKSMFVLFVNGRLVSSRKMKEAVFKVYKKMISEDYHPLVYIEVEADKSKVDVNVHPCKKEVMLDDEDSIIGEICTCISNALRISDHVPREIRHSLGSSQSSVSKVYADPMSQSIDECFEDECMIDIRSFMLESLSKMMKEIVDVDTDFFKMLFYVGVKDKNTVLVQYNTALLNCKSKHLLKEYFWQALVNGFGNFRRRSVSIPISTVIADRMKMMLDDYFCIIITDDAIVSLPEISGVCVDYHSLWSDFSVEEGPEYETLAGVIEKLSAIYSEAEMNQKLFNCMKREIKGTKAALECFGLVVTLKELYKNFERC